MAETAAAAGQVETPSGKGAGEENFPVASRLVAAPLRPHVMRFYAFARAADDIADNPALAPQDKVARLDRFEAALHPAGDLETPRRLAESLSATGVTDRHARDLLSAFRQDAVKARYRDYAELIDYCERSANPVGRFLLDLHGEDPAGYPASDALCTVLQILNHLQDCKADYLSLDRVYLPLDFLEEAGTEVATLSGTAASPALRQVLDRTLAACDGLLATARTLAPSLADRRLAAESAVIVDLAGRLRRRLAAADPLATRVKPTRGDFARAALAGVGRLLVHGRAAA